jgi:arginase
MTFTIIGVPAEGSGQFNGVEQMPAALRAAGLVEQLGFEDVGDLPVTLDDPTRDPATGIIGFEALCGAAETVRNGVQTLLEQGKRPLVIGGDCTLLIGVFAALRQTHGRVGLAFVDGHLDFYDGMSSPTGEGADMDLAILTGFGPEPLVSLGGFKPLVEPGDVVVIGYRDAEQAALDGAPDPAQVAPALRLFDADTVTLHGIEVALNVLSQFVNNPGKFWLHLDFDVLDETVMPAVDYRMPGGLTWLTLETVLRPLVESPALLGIDLTIYNPTLDPDGQYAHAIVEFLGRLLR